MSIFLVWCSRAIAADPGSEPRHLLLADLGLHVIGVGYQQTLAPWFAAQVDVDLYSPWTTELFEGPPDDDVSGYVLRLRPVFWPAGRAPDGWWVSPFVQAGPAWASPAGGKDDGGVAAGGASVGYAGRIGPVHLGFGLGGQYHVGRFGQGGARPSFAGFYPTIDGTVGYAF